MSYILKKRELIEIETRQRCAQITLWGERKHSNWDNLVNVLCGLYQRTDRLQQVCIPTFVFACRATFLLVLGGLHSCLFEAFRKNKRQFASWEILARHGRYGQVRRAVPFAPWGKRLASETWPYSRCAQTAAALCFVVAAWILELRFALKSNTRRAEVLSQEQLLFTQMWEPLLPGRQGSLQESLPPSTACLAGMLPALGKIPEQQKKVLNTFSQNQSPKNKIRPQVCFFR